MVIPKAELGSYQRWQLDSFDGKPKPAAAPQPAVDAAPTTAPALPPEPEVRLPTAEDIEQMHEEAHSQGYAAGLAEGREAAATEARLAAEAFAGQYGTLIDGLQQALKELDQTVAEQLLGLAIEIADQITRAHIVVREDALLPPIREAIATLPLHHAHITLRLNPADAADVRRLLGDELAQSGTQIIEDQLISRGGCVLLAGASEVDATLETRRKRVLETIGAEPKAWQTP
ncbi:MAG: flagellar assembly protein FliH [Betaproteobacteria bacterium HGW-Betaproteobacteria-7]|jgi:flagellar assembly protein FliH|nr:MAG: flagellar assembly protein FliH [Betaproteobacteria bacterium HGW-Betaproteobacteria-7]